MSRWKETGQFGGRTGDWGWGGGGGGGGDGAHSGVNRGASRLTHPGLIFLSYFILFIISVPVYLLVFFLLIYLFMYYCSNESMKVLRALNETVNRARKNIIPDCFVVFALVSKASSDRGISQRTRNTKPGQARTYPHNTYPYQKLSSTTGGGVLGSFSQCANRKTKHPCFDYCSVCITPMSAQSKVLFIYLLSYLSVY